MTILYLGTYDPAYPRNRVLIKGLRQAGVQVIECASHAPGLLKYISLAGKLLRHREKFDMIVVGFPAQEATILSSLLTNKPIVFDGFASHYGGYVLDRAKYASGSLMAWWALFLDRTAVRRAQLTLTDTQAHVRFFRDVIGATGPIVAIPVGTDSEVFHPMPREKNTPFTVHFHGNYIPLQGVECIVRAAELLRDKDVHFRLIGRGQTFQRDHALARELGVTNIEFVPRVPYTELPRYIAASDVCLGIFGTTPKTGLVIPNKVYEAMACERPVLTADTPAVRELLTHRQTAYLCPTGDPQALADAILDLKGDSDLRASIARAGRELFTRELTERRLGERLLSVLRTHFKNP